MTMRNVAIVDVAEVNPRLIINDKPKPQDAVSFVPMASVSEESLSIEAPEERPYAEVAKGYTPFQRGDIIVAKITPCFENGKMAHTTQLPHRQAFGSTEFHVIRPGKEVDGAYLFHLLRAPYIRRAGQMKMKGAAGQRRVPSEFFANLQIPLPPLAEQKRIASILDAADALRAKRRESLAQLDTLLQSTFLEMFGDPFSADANLKHVPFSDLTTRITYGFTSPMSHIEEGIPIVTAKNVLDGHIDLEKVHYADQAEFDALTDKSKPRPGDVLITKDGSIGRCAVVPAGLPICINQSVALIIPNRDAVLPEYVSAYIRSDAVQQRIQRMGKGNALKHLQITELAKFPTVLPPLERQRQFTEIVESIGRQKIRLRAHLAELETLFASLQSRAFKGEL